MIQKIKKVHTIFAAGVVGFVSALVALFGVAKNNNESVLTDFGGSDLKFFLSLNNESSEVHADSRSSDSSGCNSRFGGCDSSGGSRGGIGASSGQGGTSGFSGPGGASGLRD